MINYKALKSYFDNSCTPPEAEAVRTWLDSNSGTKFHDDLLRKIWDEMGDHPRSSQDLKAEFSQFKQSRSRIIFKHRVSLLSRVAAVLFVPILVLSLYLFNIDNSTELLYTELTTSIKEQKECRLPDGSIVTLSGSSKLSYSSEYGLTERRIAFEGDAKFKIQTDTAKKFIVSTAKMNVVVTGTIFKMVAHPNEKQTIVELEEGGVNVSFVNSPNTITHITPNQRAVLDNDSGEIAVSVIEETLNMISNDNPLIIEAQTFKSTMALLERHFNMEIRIKGKMNSELFSCRFTSNDIYNILDIMKYYYDFTYIEEKGVITITCL